MAVAYDVENRSHRLAIQVLFAGLVLVAYTVVAHRVNIIPYPLEILLAFRVQLSRGVLVEATINALYAIFTGYFLAIGVGIPVGLVLGVSRVSEEFFDPYLDALYALPLAAIVPAMIIWFGSGFTIRVVGVFLFAVFPIIINTLNGAKNTPVGLLEPARSFGASRFFLITRVILPYEATYITTGLRLSINLAVKGLVVVEIIVAVTGFGGIIYNWGSALQLEGVFSVVLMLMLLGVVLTWLLTLIENHLVHWDITEQ